ncbi:MAG: tripartite tricarboxylate transporter substrate binding protein BugD [Gemmatimonadales bacterium]|nr:tripartite tricarboxylate transporter substrate binding protein BugD [Gemmatimonadales bacterium]
MFRRLLACVLAVCASLSAIPAAVLAFPVAPITIVVPYAEGGPTDALAKVLATSLRGALGARVDIEHVAGAGGTVGAARVARARPDGHTLLLADNAIAIAPSLYRKLPFEPLRDFMPIGLADRMPLVLVARSGLPLPAVDSLASFIRSQGRRLSIADAGNGSPSQLCMLLLAASTRGELATASYKGSPQAFADVISGQVDLVCDIASQALPHIRSGKVRPLAITTGRRHAMLPGVPTLVELGLKEFDFAVWHMLLAPVATPQSAVDKLRGALQTALKDPEVIRQLDSVGSTVAASGQATPAAARNLLMQELSRWSPIIHKAGLTAG